MNKEILTIAIKNFKRVVYENAFSDKVLSSFVGDINGKNFVKYTLLGSLRDYFFIKEFLLGKYLDNRKFKKSDKFLISSLFVALFLLKDSRKKDYAIVNVMVDVIKKEVNEGSAKMFNGIIRNAIRDGLYNRDIQKLAETSDFYKKIKRDFGDKYQTIIENLLFSEIKVGGFFYDSSKNDDLEISNFSDEYYFVKPEQMENLSEKFVFQDLANHLLMKSFSKYITEEKTSLETSSYPGGKSFYINKGKTTHCDILEWKVDALKNRLQNILGKKASFKVVDASKMPFENESFDNVFADVPCSGSGIIKKKPEIAINFTELNMKDTISLQKDILEEASRVVKKGGRIFYSTCSIFKGENEQQIKKFLSKHKNFILDKDYNAPILEENFYSSINELNNMDGIFGTVLKKINEEIQ